MFRRLPQDHPFSRICRQCYVPEHVRYHVAVSMMQWLELPSVRQSLWVATQYADEWLRVHTEFAQLEATWQAAYRTSHPVRTYQPLITSICTICNKPDCPLCSLGQAFNSMTM